MDETVRFVCPCEEVLLCVPTWGVDVVIGSLRENFMALSLLSYVKYLHNWCSGFMVGGEATHEILPHERSLRVTHFMRMFNDSSCSIKPLFPLKFHAVSW